MRIAHQTRLRPGFLLLFENEGVSEVATLQGDIGVPTDVRPWGGKPDPEVRVLPPSPMAAKLMRMSRRLISAR